MAQHHGADAIRPQLHRIGVEHYWILEGRLTYGAVEAFRALVLDALGEERIERVLLDLQGLTQIDSAGLGILVVLHSELGRRNGQLALVAPSAPQMKLLQACRLHLILPILVGLEARETRARFAQTDPLPIPWPEVPDDA